MDDCAVYRAKEKTARTRHICCECLKDIEPGERYVRIGGVWDGRGQTFKHCVECHEVFTQADEYAREQGWDYEDGPTFHGLYSWLVEDEIISYANMTEEEYNNPKTRLSILKEQALSFFREREEDDHRLVS